MKIMSRRQIEIFFIFSARLYRLHWLLQQDFLYKKHSRCDAIGNHKKGMKRSSDTTWEGKGRRKMIQK